MDIDDIRAELNSGVAVDIRKHGGSTSLTDNSTALQYAINEAVSFGVSVVRIPPGTFQFAAGEPKVTIPPGSTLCLVGAPYGGTRLQIADSTDHSTFIQCGVATLVIRDIEAYGAVGTPTAGKRLRFVNVEGGTLRLEHVRTRYWNEVFKALFDTATELVGPESVRCPSWRLGCSTWLRRPRWTSSWSNTKMKTLTSTSIRPRG